MNQKNLNSLSDSFGRKLRKLRVSLIDACNFRCTYCMPEDAHFAHQSDHLSAAEFVEIVSQLQSRGVEEVRVTGGEPTVRYDFIEIMKGLSAIPLKKLSLTTNAFYLEKFLPELIKTNCTSINVSIDSLNPDRFYKMTKSNSLEKVLKATIMAKKMGFNVKVNCVVMKDQNILDLQDFVDFSAREQIEVRFLELMKIGVMNDHFENHFFSAKEMMTLLKKDSTWKRVETSVDSTSFNFKLDNGAQVGFIASESMPFCQHCSRLRLDSKGILRGCLMKEEGYSIRNVPIEKYDEVLYSVVQSKPMDRIVSIDRPMYLMGG